MNPGWTAEGVRTCVCRQLAVVLSVPLESIHPESRIQIDLGAESLDLLDLMFRLEDALHIKLDARELSEVANQKGVVEDFRERFTVEALSLWLLARVERAHAGA